MFMEQLIPRTKYEKEILDSYNKNKTSNTWWVKISSKQWQSKLKDLTPIQRCLWVSLKLYAGTNGKAWPSAETLANELDVSIRTIKRNLKAMQAKKFITKKSQPGRVNLIFLKEIA